MDTLKLLGTSAQADYYDPVTWEVFLREGEVIDQAAADWLVVFGLVEVEAALHGEEIRKPSKQWMGWGMNGNAVARVWLIKPGTGEVRVNGEAATAYFAKTPQKGQAFLERLLALPEVRGRLGELDAVAKVRGSCETCTQQAHAVAHGLARVLWTYDGELRVLRRLGYGQRKVEWGVKFGDTETG